MGLTVADKVLEVGMISTVWAQTAMDRWVLEEYEELETQLGDPGIPIPEHITKLTGLRDVDVVGRKIDWKWVRGVIADHQLVIAHNAGFDRPMVHASLMRESIPLPFTPWACSYEQIGWLDKPNAAPVQKLAVLAMWNGFFYPAHRALNDCRALVHLLNITGEITTLFDTMADDFFMLFCPKGSFGFAMNDEVKALGFRWNPERGGWWKMCLTKAQKDETFDALRDRIYGPSNIGNVIVQTITPAARFIQ